MDVSWWWRCMDDLLMPSWVSGQGQGQAACPGSGLVQAPATLCKRPQLSSLRPNAPHQAASCSPGPWIFRAPPLLRFHLPGRPVWHSCWARSVRVAGLRFKSRIQRLPGLGPSVWDVTLPAVRPIGSCRPLLGAPRCPRERRSPGSHSSGRDGGEAWCPRRQIQCLETCLCPMSRVLGWRLVPRAAETGASCSRGGWLGAAVGPPSPAL